MDLVSASAEKLQALPQMQGKKEEVLNSDKLEEWLTVMKEKAGRMGGGEAQFTLGQHYFTRERYNEALDYFEQAAAAESGGWGQAMYQLGVMYYDGLGVQTDMKQGFECMLAVATSTKKQNLELVPSAQYNVGRAHFMGFGVAQSDSQAETWWLLAGNHGNDPSSVRAQSTLGMFYSRSETFDLDKAFYWTKLAAENGHLESMAALGLLYVRHNHGNEDALRWLKHSSEGGCVYGTGLLAYLYLIRKLFSKAAETAFKVSEMELTEECSSLDSRGVAVGCFVLARCLQLGQAVTRNEEKALHYYTKAIKLDKRVVAELHNLLTHGKV